MGTLREALQAAMDKHEIEPVDGADTAASADEESADDAAGQVDAGAAATTDSAADHAPEGAADAAADGAEAASEPSEAARSTRDEQGRFRKKAAGAAEPTPADKAAAATAEKPAAEQASAAPLRAPSSMKPAAREKFAAAPREVQEDILRIDKEVRAVMQERAGLRSAFEQVQRTFQPFEAMIRASQKGQYNPLAAVQAVFGTVATLKGGSAAQKATTLADLIDEYGIDIGSLDRELSRRYGGAADAGATVGQPPQRVPQQAQEFRDPRLDQLLAERDQQEQFRQRQTFEHGQREVETFASDPKNEFFEDLREEMALLMDAATRAGRTLSLGDAYKRALAQSDEHQSILKQRAEAAAAQARIKSNQKARRAAASVRSNPTGTTGREDSPIDRRAQLAEAWEQAESR